MRKCGRLSLAFWPCVRRLPHPSSTDPPTGYCHALEASGLYSYYSAIHAGERAGCSQRVIPHRLRHTFATEMLRLGISLPALMQLLGHKDIHMTLLYLEVTQQDLQRQFHFARQNAVQRHLIPKVAL